MYEIEVLLGQRKQKAEKLAVVVVKIIQMTSWISFSIILKSCLGDWILSSFICKRACIAT